MSDFTKFTHYHVSLIGSTLPTPVVIAMDAKSADSEILKMAELATTHGYFPTKVVDNTIYLNDGSYIRKRSCSGDCHLSSSSQNKHVV